MIKRPLCSEITPPLAHVRPWLNHNDFANNLGAERPLRLFVSALVETLGG